MSKMITRPKKVPHIPFVKTDGVADKPPPPPAISPKIRHRSMRVEDMTMPSGPNKPREFWSTDGRNGKRTTEKRSTAGMKKHMVQISGSSMAYCITNPAVPKISFCEPAGAVARRSVCKADTLSFARIERKRTWSSELPCVMVVAPSSLTPALTLFSMNWMTSKRWYVSDSFEVQRTSRYLAASQTSLFEVAYTSHCWARRKTPSRNSIGLYLYSQNSNVVARKHRDTIDSKMGARRMTLSLTPRASSQRCVCFPLAFRQQKRCRTAAANAMNTMPNSRYMTLAMSLENFVSGSQKFGMESETSEVSQSAARIIGPKIIATNSVTGRMTRRIK
mmetsp:Transcript_112814/g.318997  ORF Transcript_112814/g.318997 Transcript_112814/m.318997 type:complete len:333 (+) Transcript_112814:1854-2852(+)